MRLTTVFRSTAAAVGIAGVIAAAMLVLSSTRLRMQTEQLAAATAAIRAAEGLELSLLIHERERRLQASAPGPHHLAGMSNSREQALRWLQRTKEHVGTPAEQQLVDTLESELKRYFAAVDAGATLNASSVDLGAAVKSATRLVDLNAADAERALNQAESINQRAIIAAITASVLLVLSLIVTLFLVRREIYSPIIELAGALRAFASRGTHVRLHSHGVQELRELATEFNEMVARLQAAEAQQVRFLAGVAHDLKNPLSALKLTASALARGREAEGDEKLKKGLERIGSHVDNLDRMVGDLLDRTRIEAGDVSLQLGACDLRTIADEVVELHRAVSAAHKLVLELPEEAVEIRCDRVRMSQVLTNLVSNAIKYSPQGGTVSVRIATNANEALIEVTDQGVGIAPEELHRVFEPFHRSKGPAADIPGVGLGLSVTKKMVEAHRGRIEVESRPEGGSTFRVRLPRAA